MEKSNNCYARVHFECIGKVNCKHYKPYTETYTDCVCFQPKTGMCDCKAANDEALKEQLKGKLN